MHKRFALKSIAIGTMAMGSMAVLTACSEQKPSFASVDVTGANYAKDFELTDPRTERWNGMRGSTGSLHSGHWVIDHRGGVARDARGGVSTARVTFADDIGRPLLEIDDAGDTELLQSEQIAEPGRSRTSEARRAIPTGSSPRQ